MTNQSSVFKFRIGEHFEIHQLKDFYSEIFHILRNHIPYTYEETLRIINRILSYNIPIEKVHYVDSNLPLHNILMKECSFCKYGRLDHEEELCERCKVRVGMNTSTMSTMSLYSTDEGEKQCTGCLRVLSLDMYRKNGVHNGKIRFRSKCKDCGN